MFGRKDKGYRYCSKVFIKMPSNPTEFTLACTHYGDKKMDDKEAIAMANVFGKKTEWKIEVEDLHKGKPCA